MKECTLSELIKSLCERDKTKYIIKDTDQPDWAYAKGAPSELYGGDYGDVRTPYIEGARHYTLNDLIGYYGTLFVDDATDVGDRELLIPVTINEIKGEQKMPLTEISCNEERKQLTELEKLKVAYSKLQRQHSGATKALADIRDAVKPFGSKDATSVGLVLKLSDRHDRLEKRIDELLEQKEESMKQAMKHRELIKALKTSVAIFANNISG